MRGTQHAPAVADVREERHAQQAARKGVKRELGDRRHGWPNLAAGAQRAEGAHACTGVLSLSPAAARKCDTRVALPPLLRYACLGLCDAAAAALFVGLGVLREA
jgi:hypothetical protein